MKALRLEMYWSQRVVHKLKSIELTDFLLRASTLLRGGGAISNRIPIYIRLFEEVIENKTSQKDVLRFYTDLGFARDMY